MAAVFPTAKKPEAAKPAGAAKPGTADAKAAKPAKEKIVKILHPALEADKDGKPTKKLKEIPADLNVKRHKPLMRKNFEDESMFFELKAREFDAKAADFRKQAVEYKALGGAAKSGAAKRLLAMQKRIDELKKQLTDQGLDVGAILAAATTVATPAAAATA